MKFLNSNATLDGALDGDSSMRLWLRHIQKLWPVYTVGTLAVLTTDAAEVMVPKLVQWTIDALSDRSKPLNQYIWAFLILLVVQFVARVMWRQTQAQQTHRVAARFKSIIWDRARFFPRARLETDLSPGELMNIATGDVGTARMMFGFTIVGTIDFIFLLGFTVSAMLLIDWQLTLLSLITLPGLPFLLDKLSRRESEQHHTAQESLSALTDLAAQAVSTVRLQRLTQSGAFWRAKLEDAAKDYKEKRFNVVATSLDFIPITGLAPLISYAILIAFGVHKVIAGEMSLGAFVAMQSFIFMIQGPLLELGTIVSEWQRCLASLNRITELLRQPEESSLRAGGITVEATPTAFEVKALNFSYTPSSRKIIRNLNFSLPSGQRLGIRGPIGSGKSTLLHLLGGFDKNFDGEITLYGKNLKEVSHQSLRQHIAFVPQRSFLFADTLRSNLLIDRECSDEELWFYLDLAGLASDIQNFPQKLDTRLGEWGVNLSGGQRQRMTLARGLIGKPEILLLDDCLSAVDTLTEEKILKGLDTHLKKTTLLWVAHRDSTLQYCDRILELSSS